MLNAASRLGWVQNILHAFFWAWQSSNIICGTYKHRNTFSRTQLGHNQRIWCLWCRRMYDTIANFSEIKLKLSLTSHTWVVLPEPVSPAMRTTRFSLMWREITSFIRYTGRDCLKVDRSEGPLSGGTWGTPLFNLPVVVLFISREEPIKMYTYTISQ